MPSIVPWHCVTEPTNGATQSPKVIPFTLHVTPALGVAAKDCTPPAGMVSAAGFTTKVCAATTFTLVVPVFEPDVAVMVTPPGVLGAVKRPVPSIVPALAVHATEVLAPFRNAENWAVWLIPMLEEPGRTTRSFIVG